MNDRVLMSFLRAQHREAMELADHSNILSLETQAAGTHPPRTFVARYQCHGVVYKSTQPEVVQDDFVVGIRFPEDYLRRPDSVNLVTWLWPPVIFSPHVMFPAMCCGRLDVGSSLVDILYQLYEIITYANYAPHDALNHRAAQWARNHQHLFPVDRRPLKRPRGRQFRKK